MRALLISRDSHLYSELASQGAARVPPLHLAATRASLREALDRPEPDAPQLVIGDASGLDAEETPAEEHEESD